LDCGRGSYRFLILAALAHPKLKAVAGATALQGASRIFIPSGEPEAHEVCAQDDYDPVTPRTIRPSPGRGDRKVTTPKMMSPLPGLNRDYTDTLPTAGLAVGHVIPPLRGSDTPAPLYASEYFPRWRR